MTSERKMPPINHKFKVGDRVLFAQGRLGLGGTIVELVNHRYGDYIVQADMGGGRGIYWEHNLELAAPTA